MNHAIAIFFALIASLSATPSLARTYTPEDIAELDRVYRERVLKAVLRTLGTEADLVKRKQLVKFVADDHWKDIRDRVRKALAESCPYSSWGGACSQITFEKAAFRSQLTRDVYRISTKFDNQKAGTVDQRRPSGIGADQILELLKESLGTPTLLKMRDVLAMGGFRMPDQNIVPETTPPGEEPSFRDALANVRFRRSFLDRHGISLPASIAYTSIGGGDDARKERADSPNNERVKPSSYSLRGALEWSPQLLRTRGRLGVAKAWAYTVRGLLVYEADISSVAAHNRDILVHRLGTRWIAGKVTDSASWFSGVLLDSTLDYRTDRRYDAKVYGLTVNLTPNMYRLGVGFPLRVPGPRNLWFRWRPYASLNYADINDAGGSQTFANRNGYLNLLLKVSGEIRFWNRFVLTAELTQTRELRNAKQGHTHFLTNGQLLFDEEGNLSLNLGYQRGELAPTFPKRERFGVELGVKF